MQLTKHTRFFGTKLTERWTKVWFACRFAEKSGTKMLEFVDATTGVGGRGGCIGGWSSIFCTSTGTWFNEFATPLPEGLSVNDLPGGNEFTQSWTSFWFLSDPLSLSKISSNEWWLNNARLSIDLAYSNSAAATRCRWSSSNSWSTICSIWIWSSFFLMAIFFV